jgi:hypothetical protein
MGILPKAVATLALVLLAASCSASIAADRNDWYKSLKMPGTNASCCEIADCHSTDADWRNDQWWVVINGKWQRVPDAKVLASPPSIDGSAYVCLGTPSWSFGGPPPTEPIIYCFVPPNWSM